MFGLLTGTAFTKQFSEIDTTQYILLYQIYKQSTGRNQRPPISTGLPLSPFSFITQALLVVRAAAAEEDFASFACIAIPAASASA